MGPLCFPTLHLVLLSLLLFGSHATTDSDLVITVKEGGDDVPSCLKSNGSRACYTLHYVLQQISGNELLFNTSSIFVNVTWNQSIATPVKYLFSIPLNLTVTVSGANQPFINCKSNTLLAITADEVSTVHWVWKMLVFSGCGFKGPDNFHYSGLVHTSLSSLTILHCKILMVTGLDISDIHQVTINNTEFGQSSNFRSLDCNMLIKTTCIRSRPIAENSTFLFADNTVSDYTSSTCSSAPAYIYVCYAKVAILNNTFSRLISRSNRATGSIIALVGGTHSLSIDIKNNNFLQNIVGSIHISVSEYIDVFQCIIQMNAFLNNTNTQDVRLYSHIQVHAHKHHANGTVAFLGNLFFNNYGYNLFYSHLSLGTGFLFILIDGLHIIDNKCNSCLPLQFTSDGQLRGQKVALKNVLIKRNTLQSSQLFASYGAGFITVENMTKVTITNAKFISNFLSSLTQNVYVVDVYGTGIVSITNVTFIMNIGTPLCLTALIGHLKLALSGTLLFVNNTGILGGACALHSVTITKVAPHTEVIFERNSAVYGGAVYADDVELKLSKCDMKLTFLNNYAISAGSSVYFAKCPDKAIAFRNWCDLELDSHSINSFATYMRFIPNTNYATHLSIFPGQEVILNASIYDYFWKPSSCTANGYLLFEDLFLTRPDVQVKLKGSGTVVFTQAPNETMTTVNTKLIILYPEDPIARHISLQFFCKSSQVHGSTYIPAHMTVPLNITRCPLGFVYHKKESVCKCAEVVEKNGFLCSLELGAACVSHGYWYGPVDIDSNTTMYVIARCTFPECSYLYDPCPPDMQTTGNTADYVHIGFDVDRQCSEGRGGTLCRSCRLGFAFTFTSTNCVSVQGCSWWQPYFILAVSLMFQLLLTFVLFLVVRFKLALGSGFLYGPMLFLAMVSHLSLEQYSEYSSFCTAISIITSIPLLNFEVFGLIPWCFFQSLAKLYNYSLRYLGALIVLAVILFISLVARWCPNALRRWQSSPLKAMCLLMLLSFWSLADTSVNILKPTVIRYSRDAPPIYVVSLQPDWRYFSLQHLPVAVPALLVLFVVILPTVFLLPLSSVLSKTTNLYRIKPFLDEFQSCYKDRYRWYSAVYFIAWIIIVTIQEFSLPAGFTQTILILLWTAQFLIQPYQSRLLNIADTLLLANLNILTALVESKSVTSLATILLVHTLVISPFLCIGVWFSCACIVKCGVYGYLHDLWTRRRRHTSGQQLDREERDGQSPPVPVQVVSIFDKSGEREPLIGIVNDN